MSVTEIIIPEGEALHLAATSDGELSSQGSTVTIAYLYAKCRDQQRPLTIYAHDANDWTFATTTNWSADPNVSGAVYTTASHTSGDEFHEDIVNLQMINQADSTKNKIKTLPIKIKPLGDGPDR